MSVYHGKPRLTGPPTLDLPASLPPCPAAQELEVYLTREVLPDGFKILARIGSVMQEIRVTSPGLSRDGMKELVMEFCKNC